MNKEIMEKARSAKSAEELRAIAEENKITLSEEKAKEYFEKLSASGEISEEELENVSGGGCLSTPPEMCCGVEMIYCPPTPMEDRGFYECPVCGMRKYD